MSVATKEVVEEEEEAEAEERGAQNVARGKRSRDPVEEIVAREVKKVKEEMKEEILGTCAEYVAGLIFHKLKMFNFNQSGHEEACGSGRGEMARNGAGEKEASEEASEHE